MTTDRMLVPAVKSLDNPLILRGAFLHYRLPGAWVGISIVAALGALVCLGGILLADGSSPGGRKEALNVCFHILLGMQCLIAMLVGTSQINTHVAADRESGLLDFHRISPQSSARLVAGYVVGMTLKEWMWVFTLLPFSAFCLVLSALPPLRAAVGYGCFLLSSLFCHLLAVVCGLSLKRRKAASGQAAGIVLGMWFLFGQFGLLGNSFFMFLTYLPVLLWIGEVHAVEPSFFALSLPAPLYAALVQGTFAFFLAHAAIRKMRNDSLPGLSKKANLAMTAAFLVFMLGNVFGPVTSGAGWTLGRRGLSMDAEVILILFLCAALLVSLFSVVLATPHFGAYLRGLQRAKKRGRSSIPPFADENLGWPVILPVALMLVALPLLAFSRSLPSGLSLGSLAAAGAVAAASLLGFASMLEYTRLRFQRRGGTLFAGFLFLFWALPALLAFLLAMAHFDPMFPRMLGSLFPFSGIPIAMEARAGDFSSAVGIGYNLVLAIAFLTLASRIRGRCREAAERGETRLRPNPNSAGADRKVDLLEVVDESSHLPPPPAA